MKLEEIHQESLFQLVSYRGVFAGYTQAFSVSKWYLKTRKMINEQIDENEMAYMNTELVKKNQFARN